jgi:FtsH-binding integral membrane protein
MDPRRPQAVAAALPVATMGAEVRSRFLVRTYLHLYAAIVAFTMIEAFLFVTGLARVIAIGMLSTSWLVVLGSFVVVSWFASHVAHRTTSLPAQYAALGVYVVAEAIVFVPLLFIAEYYAPGAIGSAALLTLVGFGLLTGMVFDAAGSSRSWAASCAGAFAVALIPIAATAFGFTLGRFPVVMVGWPARPSADTSNVRTTPRDSRRGPTVRPGGESAVRAAPSLSARLNRFRQAPHAPLLTRCRRCPLDPRRGRGLVRATPRKTEQVARSPASRGYGAGGRAGRPYPTGALPQGPHGLG